MTPRRPAAKKAAAKKPAARKRAAAKNAAKRPAAKKAATRKRAPRKPKYGPVETATRAELEQLRMTTAAVGQSAILMARYADQASSASTASLAARELRISMATVCGMAGDASRAGGSDDGTVIPASRLADLRAKAAKRGS